MGDSKFFLIIVTLLTTLLLSFQGCSENGLDNGYVEGFGNGDPYEGMDGDSNAIGINIPGGSSGGSVDVTLPESDSSGGSGEGSGGAPSPDSSKKPPPPKKNPLKSYNIQYRCHGNKHLKLVAFAQHKKNKKNFVLLSAKNGKLKRFPWKPNKAKTKLSKPLSKNIFANSIILKKKQKKSIFFYLVNGSQKVKRLETPCKRKL